MLREYCLGAQKALHFTWLPTFSPHQRSPKPARNQRNTTAISTTQQQPPLDSHKHQARPTTADHKRSNGHGHEWREHPQLTNLEQHVRLPTPHAAPLYPAPELLSPGKQPIVETPRGVPDREEPELGLLGLSADDLDFFVRFPTAHGITTDGSLGKREHATLTGPQPLNLPACIDRLSTFAGVSELSFVSYVDDWDVITTFHLKTTFYTNFGKLDDKVQIFELASADVAKLIRTLSGQEEWVRQVDDLIHAKSDRSYMSRYRELANWDEDWTLDNEESWLVKWDTNPLAGSRERFAKRIVAIYQAPDGTIMREGLPDLDEFKDEGFYAELPCGHRTWMAENYIHDLRPAMYSLPFATIARSPSSARKTSRD